MITKMYVYSILKKYWLMKLEVAEVQMGQIFGRFFWGDNIIREYFDEKF